MKPKRLVDLPVPGSGCGDIRICSEANSIRIEYEYRWDGVDWVGCVHFLNVIAFRFRDEFHSVGYCSESYDSVAQIDDSDWLKELIAGEPSNKNVLGGKIHFAIFFSSNGYFEAIAEKYETPTPRRGFLSGGV